MCRSAGDGRRHAVGVRGHRRDAGPDRDLEAEEVGRRVLGLEGGVRAWRCDQAEGAGLVGLPDHRGVRKGRRLPDARRDRPVVRPFHGHGRELVRAGDPVHRNPQGGSLRRRATRSTRDEGHPGGAREVAQRSALEPADAGEVRVCSDGQLEAAGAQGPAPAGFVAITALPPAVLSVDWVHPAPGIAGTFTVAAMAMDGSSSERAAISAPTLLRMRVSANDDASPTPPGDP